MTTVKALFPFGQIVATPGALSALGAEGITPFALISRHLSGDWGRPVLFRRIEAMRGGRPAPMRDACPLPGLPVRSCLSAPPCFPAASLPLPAVERLSLILPAGSR